MTHWYYKYLPFYFLEWKLKRKDPYYSDIVELKDKYNLVLLEISEGVWIGTNKRDFIVAQIEQLEREIESKKSELEALNVSLCNMGKDIAIFHTEKVE
jgi:hypothetical protein